MKKPESLRERIEKELVHSGMVRVDYVLSPDDDVGKLAARILSAVAAHVEACETQGFTCSVGIRCCATSEPTVSTGPHKSNARLIRASDVTSNPPATGGR